MTRTVRILLLFFALTMSSTVLAGRNQSVDSWMDQSLIPSVIDQLSTHPRFEADVVRFVVLDNGRPAAVSNELALALRDKLQAAVVDRTDIRVAWQVNREVFNRESEVDRIDCTASDVHYYIGIEVSEIRSGIHEISVRGLDVEERTWVAGFGGVWTGSLTAIQMMAFRHPASDDAFLGQRTVPFEESQTDLLAAQLAHDLGCNLLREMSGEYVAVAAESDDARHAAILGLVGNNLAPYRAIQISAGPGNSIIATSAHSVDDDLYQYWVTVTPTDPDSDMPSISASAYIYQPEQFLAAPLASVGKPSGLSNDSKLISSLDVVQLRSAAKCNLSAGRHIYNSNSSVSDGRCYALRALPSEDAIMFFLYHQLNNGLVRLGGVNCILRSDVTIARRNEPESVPLLMDISGSPSWLPNDEWMIDPDEDTFYAIATSDSKAARALASHFRILPQRCGRSLRPGLDGADLRRWFRELEAIADNWPSSIDPQSCCR